MESWKVLICFDIFSCLCLDKKKKNVFSTSSAINFIFLFPSLGRLFVCFFVWFNFRYFHGLQIHECELIRKFELSGVKAIKYFYREIFGIYTYVWIWSYFTLMNPKLFYTALLYINSFLFRPNQHLSNKGIKQTINSWRIVFVS